jgi:hypothetical protein
LVKNEEPFFWVFKNYPTPRFWKVDTHLLYTYDHFNTQKGVDTKSNNTHPHIAFSHGIVSPKSHPTCCVFFFFITNILGSHLGWPLNLLSSSQIRMGTSYSLHSSYAFCLSIEKLVPFF